MSFSKGVKIVIFSILSVGVGMSSLYYPLWVGNFLTVIDTQIIANETSDRLCKLETIENQEEDIYVFVSCASFLE